MSVTTPILFGIGVVGGDKAKAQLGMVAAGAVIAAAAVVKLWKAADEYGDALAALTVDMGKYNTATKGLIDTTTGIQGANKLTAAGAKVTAEQFAALGKAAIVLSRATGTDTTEAFNRLTESVSKGSSRALKEVGIDLENTEDLALAQAEALQKLTDKYGALNIQIEDAGELFYALGNNIGTMTNQSVTNVGKLVSSIPGIGTALQGVNDWLTKTTSLWEETGGAMYDFYNIGTQVGIVIDYISARLSGNTFELGAAMGRWQAFKNQLIAVNAMTKVKAPAEAGGVGAVEAGLQSEMADFIRAEDAKSQKKGGGGGGGRRPKVSTADDLLANYGTMKQPDFDGGSIYDAANADPFLEEEIAAEEARQKALLETQVAGWDQKWQAELFAAEAEKQLQAEKHEWMLANSEEYAAAQRAITLDTAMEYTEGVGAMFANLGSLMETKSKKAFEIGKKASIASAVISTALAAVQAFTSFTSIPIVGVPLGIAAAAAAVVAGAVQIAKIKATTFEGGSSSSTSSFTASTPSASGGSYPADTSAGGSGDGTPIQINIKIGDESFGDVMTRINDKRSQRGQQAFKVA